MKLSEFMEHKKTTGTALAAALGVRQPTVSAWVTGKKQIPAERCPTIERLTERAVTCEELRPDVDWHVLRGVSATPLGGSDAGFAAEIPGAPRTCANEPSFTGAPAPEAA